jgi:hypothetical protein
MFGTVHSGQVCNTAESVNIKIKLLGQELGITALHRSKVDHSGLTPVEVKLF